ncbi:o-succinylbenzoate--CoA ligase [Photobacterium sp. 1_MG-2023]|uniref:o-succinylbenzoate--CoA ligase n=1 Tax=Photobacterium sp. 1_MG-2023 TaxID=3062646 RepID=UPI0026E17BD8|nr:o-succinylbenzoate--CoA ligase [Photobacterium sp. 1_MG-2023]MDO6707199.1 o-succinylbenzoate--CoA ligase [Photobacterium sp. 1_MG-2023]
MMTSDSLWRHWAAVRPEHLALRTADESYNWRTLAKKVDALAAHLSAQGVASGDVVTVIGKNSPALVFLHLACLQLGVTTAFVMPQPAIRLSEKLAVLYRPGQPHWVWFGPVQPDDPSDSANKADGLPMRADITLLDLDAAFSSAPRKEAVPETACRSERLASILFTSGSEGVPKAVAHTQAQHLASARGLLAVFSFQPSDCWLLSLPLYHVSGLAIVYRWLSVGACLKVGRGALAQDIQDVTHASLVVTQLKRLLERQPPLSLSQVLLGGSDVPVALCQQAAQQGIQTWLGYGMTEAASTVTAKQIDGIATAGRVLPNRQVQLINNRILIGGDTLASGYFHQGKITPLVDAQGWFDTRDLGQWIDGELRILGRADNQFISGGENIHCEEIEGVLNRHPAIRQSMVIPVACEVYGARPVALIDTSEELTALNLTPWLANRLERFKFPDTFYRMPQLPQTGMKVSRKAMKDWLMLRRNTATTPCA